MAFSRRLGVMGIVAASWLVALGCDDDEDIVSPGAGAGEAGEAPSGGKSSVAGSTNNGGKAGSSASAGSAGKGGTATGGAAGTNAMGGDAGSGENPGGAGQAGSAGASGAGGEGVGGAAGGQAGAGGEGGTPEPVAPAPHCSFACVGDEDCLVDGDDTMKCNLTTHACEDPSQACTVDANCLPILSSWFKPCVDDTQCTANTEACVAADGQGFCATLPADSGLACAGSNVSKILPRFGAQGTISVCAHPDARCFNRVCVPGCGAPSRGCGTGNGDHCSATTGLCECSDGTECETTGICGQDGHCQECVTSDDCAENVTDTVCVGGKCGCGSADACSVLDLGYQNAIATCQ